MDRLIIGLAAISFAAALLAITAHLIGAVLRYRRRWQHQHLRGAQLGTLPHTQDDGLLTLAGVSIPRELETRHVMLTGTTGSGKTVAMSEMLAATLNRGDRAVIVDPGGQFLAWFYNPSRDVILNPFDTRSPGWSVYHEVRGDYDWDKLARSVVPDPIGGEQWNHYAQQLFIAIGRALGQRGETSTTQALLEAATAWPLDKLAALLTGTPAAQLTDPSNARMAGSVRSVLATYLAPWKYLSPGDFSLRSFLADDTKGSVFITWREDQTKALKALTSTWLDILIAATLSLEPDNERRVWLFIDELGTLERLSSLQDALTKGRKFGLCAVLGFQTIAQLEDVYGPQQAQTLLANLGTQLFLRTPDAQTSDYCSNALGEREVIGKQHGHSHQGWLGLEGHSRSTSYSPKPQRLVLSSELQTLPDLEGFMTFPGDYPVAKVQLTYVAREARYSPFMEAGSDRSTSPPPKTLLEEVQEILAK